jgi:3-oxoadipate enol-lactonase
MTIQSDLISADLPSNRLGYQRIGTGPKLVIALHEWLAGHDNYVPMHAYLDQDSFSWIFADLRGYGLSRHVDGLFSVDEAAADVLRLADLLGAERFDLIGHSMSAMIAQKVALIARERVERMVLISPVPPSGFKTDAAGLKSMTAIIEDEVAATHAIKARTSGRYGAGWMRRKLTLMTNGTHPEPMLGYLRMFTSTDFAAEASGLDVPIKILLGTHDIDAYRLDAVSNSFRLYHDLLIEECQGAGHYMMLEAPVWTASRIETFLNAA